jgi:hypothetical protein
MIWLWRITPLSRLNLKSKFQSMGKHDMSFFVKAANKGLLQGCKFRKTCNDRALL